MIYSFILHDIFFYSSTSFLLHFVIFSGCVYVVLGVNRIYCVRSTISSPQDILPIYTRKPWLQGR